jgi:hypothetical protein
VLWRASQARHRPTFSGFVVSCFSSVEIEHSKSPGPISSVLVGHGTKNLRRAAGLLWRGRVAPGVHARWLKGRDHAEPRRRGEEEETSQGLGMGQGHHWTFPQNTEVPLTISAPPRLRVVPLARPVVPGVVAFWFFPPLPSLALTSFREWGARQVVERKGSRGDAEARRRRGDGPRAWDGARPLPSRSTSRKRGRKGATPFLLKKGRSEEITKTRQYERVPERPTGLGNATRIGQAPSPPRFVFSCFRDRPNPIPAGAASRQTTPDQPRGR